MLAPAMEADRIAGLLEPYLSGEPLAAKVIGQLQAYLDLLLRWNARMNLTAVRGPEQIVTRHFGESLFAARVLRDAGAISSPSARPVTLADVGSGAGFPGVPIKLAFPDVQLALIESQNKKATFLREVIRIVQIDGAEVFGGRAEVYGRVSDVVTMRAAERFESALQIATKLLASNGRLCLLVGAAQRDAARSLVPELEWQVEAGVPLADSAMVMVGKLP
jgi:16S rRNA (guanine527-N7)-methyltransferase